MDSQLPPEHDTGTPPLMQPAVPPALMSPAVPPPLMQPAGQSPPMRPGGRRVLPLVALGVLIGGIVGGAAGATLMAQRQRSAVGGPALIFAPHPSGPVLPE